MLQVAIGIALLMLGIETGLVISWLYYRDKLKGQGPSVRMLEAEVKDWRAKAAEWEAKARAFYELLHGEDQKE